MQTKKDLNLFRKNDLGYLMLQIAYNNGSAVQIPFIYNDYFEATFSKFLEELQRFENKTQIPNAINPELLSVMVDLFASLEIFFSTLHKICFFFYKEPTIPSDERGMKKIFNKDFLLKINDIFDYAQINSQDYKSAEYYKKLKEFQDVRNYIVHGNIGKIKTKFSTFTDVPLTINYNDIVEAMYLIINTMDYFRYIIPNADLMPDVRVIIKQGNDHTIFWKKLDVIIENIINPMYKNILLKHNLTSSIEYHKIDKGMPPTNSTIAKRINVFIKAEMNNIFQHDMSKEQTNYYWEYMPSIISKEEVNKQIQDQTFSLPKFMLN